jgi:hypothetical protein
VTVDECLPLLESDTETTHLGFQRCDMAYRTHRNAAEIVSSASGLG